MYVPPEQWGYDSSCCVRYKTRVHSSLQTVTGPGFGYKPHVEGPNRYDASCMHRDDEGRIVQLVLRYDVRWSSGCAEKVIDNTMQQYSVRRQR